MRKKSFGSNWNKKDADNFIYDFIQQEKTRHKLGIYQNVLAELNGINTVEEIRQFCEKKIWKLKTGLED